MDVLNFRMLEYAHGKLGWGIFTLGYNLKVDATLRPHSFVLLRELHTSLCYPACLFTLPMFRSAPIECSVSYAVMFSALFSAIEIMVEVLLFLALHSD